MIALSHTNSVVANCNNGEPEAVESSEDSAVIDEEHQADEDGLTELELATLEDYERNCGTVLDQFQILRREENKKRLALF
ncbi:unnamed protein product [Strongylus vulgaris]|uniref:Uncharacterized protein n=1 Tax=Strongylus vulgaris TaxID=40348 RepID=A0A3P7I7P5_STRVU|nr:unnamed protein product [Strongylus vulgaris]